MANPATEYAPDVAAELELIGIDGAPMINEDGSPMTISLLGEDSEVATAYDNSVTNRQIEQAKRGASLTTAESLKANTASKYAKLTTGWNIAVFGERPAFSQDAARALYLNRKASFITDQVEAFVRARKNFLRVSSPS